MCFKMPENHSRRHAEPPTAKGLIRIMLNCAYYTSQYTNISLCSKREKSFDEYVLRDLGKVIQNLHVDNNLALM